jgi:hypothetical protein
MSEVTKELHRNLIRAAKAALAAWERWLKDKDQPT